MLFCGRYLPLITSKLKVHHSQMNLPLLIFPASKTALIIVSFRVCLLRKLSGEIGMLRIRGRLRFASDCLSFQIGYQQAMLACYVVTNRTDAYAFEQCTPWFWLTSKGRKFRNSLQRLAPSSLRLFLVRFFVQRLALAGRRRFCCHTLLLLTPRLLPSIRITSLALRTSCMTVCLVRR